MEGSEGITSIEFFEFYFREILFLFFSSVHFMTDHANLEAFELYLSLMQDPRVNSLSLGYPTIRHLMLPASQASLGSRPWNFRKLILERSYLPVTDLIGSRLSFEHLPGQELAAQATRDFFGNKLEPSDVDTLPNQQAAANSYWRNSLAAEYNSASPYISAYKYTDMAETAINDLTQIFGTRDIVYHAHHCPFRNAIVPDDTARSAASRGPAAPAPVRSSTTGVAEDFRAALLRHSPAPPIPDSAARTVDAAAGQQQLSAGGDEIGARPAPVCPAPVQSGPPPSYAARLTAGLPAAGPAAALVFGRRKRPGPTGGGARTRRRMGTLSASGDGGMEAGTWPLPAAAAGGDGDDGWGRSRSAAIAVAQLVT